MNQPAAVEKLQVELGMYILVVTIGQAPLLHSHLYFVKLLAFVAVVHISFSHSKLISHLFLHLHKILCLQFQKIKINFHGMCTI